MQPRRHSKDAQEVCAVGLFLKITGDVEAATLLLERGLASQARSLLRVAIEGSIILAKICGQYEFAHAYAIVAEQERLKLVKGIKNNKHAGYDDLRTEFTIPWSTQSKPSSKDNQRQIYGNGQLM